MAIFKESLEKLLKNEGGFNNIQGDMGGATKYGISWRFYVNNIKPNATIEDIANLTQEQAEDIYFQYFWFLNNYNDLKIQSIADKMLDMAVNMGSTIANRFLQESYNAISSGQIVVDGISGSITIDAINKIPEDKIEILLECIRVLQKNHYLQIVKKRLDQQKFLKGWLKRANQ